MSDSGCASASRREFVRRHTRLCRPPAVPELQLYLADDIISLWQVLADQPDGREESPPYWAVAWAGGQALARYLLDRPDEAKNKRVLDFAGGSGMCALAAMKAGAIEAIAVDIDPYSAEAVILNAAANRVTVTAWQRDLLDDEPPPVDVVLAGDVCYEEPMAARVLPWLRAAQASGARVLLADPGRAYFPESKFRVLAKYDIPTPRDLEDSESKHTGVYAFRSFQSPSAGSDALRI